MMHGCNLHVMIGMQAMSLKVLSSVTILVLLRSPNDILSIDRCLLKFIQSYCPHTHCLAVMWLFNITGYYTTQITS